MKYNIRIISISLIFLSLCMLWANPLQAVTMPEYERLQAIATHFQAPTAVAFDSEQHIYVVEALQNRLLKYTSEGVYEATLAGLHEPLSIAVDLADRIVIGNKQIGNVEVYAQDFAPLFKLGTGNGEFSQPNAIAIDKVGDIYVVDSQEDRIKVYHPDGTLNFAFGSSGNADGQFRIPVSIAIDDLSEEIIVADLRIVGSMFGSYEGARIQIFDMDGNFKRSFGTYGATDGQFIKPLGMAVDELGRIYVSDAYLNVVHVFDNMGVFLGAIYDQEHPIRTPLGITIDPDGNQLGIASLRTASVEIYTITDLPGDSLPPPISDPGTTVPEPGTLLLVVAGLLGILVVGGKTWKRDNSENHAAQIITKICVLALALSAIGGVTDALDYPHNTTNGIGCGSCHISHNGGEGLLPAHTPTNIDDTQVNTLCWSCHNPLGTAPYEETHSSLTTDAGYGDWSIECTTCHDPHKHEQFWEYVASEPTNYYVDPDATGTVAAVTTSTLQKQGPSVWAEDQYAGLVVYPNIAEPGYSYNILSNTADTLTVDGVINTSMVTIGDTFAIVYGNLIKSTINAPERATCTVVDNEYICVTTLPREVRLFRESGANSFADGDTTYDGVCEVCHTMTQYWRADGSEPISGHNAGTNCVSCHPHASGFKASCDSCHGNPPVDTATLVTDPPAGGTTGSTTAGAHDAHVAGQGILCEVCHADSVGSGTTHNNAMTITLGFSPFGGGYEGGAYDGQSTAAYDSSEASTSVSNSGTKTCTNLYCHGAYPGSGRNASPIWDNPGSAACGTCHGASNTTHPDSGSHQEHASSSRFEFQCTLCHKDVVDGSGPSSYTIADISKHVNGVVDWTFDVSDPRVSGSSTYGIASGTARPSDGTTPRPYDTCRNVYCHSIAQTATGGNLTPDTADYTTPTWGTMLGCGDCHQDDNAHGWSGNPMNSGSHTAHLAYKFNLNWEATKCALCHKWKASAPFGSCGQCHPEYPNHANYQVDVLFDTEFGNASYNGTLAPGDGFSDCANTYCHSPGTSVSTGTIPANTSAVWGTGPIACDACHGNAPDYANGSPKANSHADHSSYTCNMCHAATTTTGTTITNKSRHVNKAYDLQAGGGASFTYTFAATGGTCTNVSCHGGGSETWGN